MTERATGRTLVSINERADLGTFHPDSLSWPERLGEPETWFYAQLCGYPPERTVEARAYLGKELAQLADIERHVSICLGIIGGQAAGSRLLAGVSIRGPGLAPFGRTGWRRQACPCPRSAVPRRSTPRCLSRAFRANSSTLAWSPRPTAVLNLNHQTG